jgi:hypothetical protein
MNAASAVMEKPDYSCNSLTLSVLIRLCEARHHVSVCNSAKRMFLLFAKTFRCQA